MRPGRAVLDEPPAVAVVAVLAQSRVERLQQFRVDAGDLDTAQQGPDVLLDHEQVPTAGRRLDIEDFEPAVQEVADVRARAWVPLLVHLAEQPGARLLRFPGGMGTWRDHLDQIVPAARQRIDAGVHPDAQGTAGQRVNRAPWRLRGPATRVTSGTLAPARVTTRVTRGGSERVRQGSALVGRTGLEPVTDRL
jgi:hypothetical protein